MRGRRAAGTGEEGGGEARVPKCCSCPSAQPRASAIRRRESACLGVVCALIPGSWLGCFFPAPRLGPRCSRQRKAGAPPASLAARHTVRPDGCSWHAPPVGLAADLKGLYAAFAVALCLAFEHSSQNETKGFYHPWGDNCERHGRDVPASMSASEAGRVSGDFAFELQSRQKGTDRLHFAITLETYSFLWALKVTATICSFALNK